MDDREVEVMGFCMGSWKYSLYFIWVRLCLAMIKGESSCYQFLVSLKYGGFREVNFGFGLDIILPST